MDQAELSKYGFEPVTQIFLDECKCNPVIIPKWYRYKGMGHYQVLAEVQSKSDFFLLFMVGGSSGWDAASNRKDMKKLTVVDAITKKQLITKLSGDWWVEVASSTETDSGQINQVQERHPSDE